MKFLIAVPMFNVADTIARTIASLREQTCRDFECWLVDDLSDDDSFEVAEKAVDGDPRFRVIRNREKRFALGNLHDMFNNMQGEDDDVALIVDGDDYLASPSALQRLFDEYQDSECWMTYGSYQYADGSPCPGLRAYSDSVIRNNQFRSAEWLGAHPRSFRIFLWRRITPDAFGVSAAEISDAARWALGRGDVRAWYHWRRAMPEDLLDASGCFVRRCYDKALLYPMFEMAGTRSRFISDAIYVYTGSPAHAHGLRSRSTRWLTRCIRRVMAAKTPFEPLSSREASA